jgi:DNA-binding transcriptional MerR regulator
MILGPLTESLASVEKSPEAYRTIREVADGMDLPQHVLRFWETRFPQIRPLKRAGGRRYYRPDDVERLRLIKRLLYEEGYTIKGVQKLFKEQGVQSLSGGFALATPQTDAKLEGVGASQAPAPSNRENESEERLSLGGSELAALRDALAQIANAERILSQARSRDS